MRQSQLFSKTRKEAPSDEVSKNAQLLIRAGFIHKEMAGVYSYLPLGLRVLKKIENIIREEMNAIGGQEIELTALQNKELWEKTNRWDDSEVDVWFKIANDKATFDPSKAIGILGEHFDDWLANWRERIEEQRVLVEYYLAVARKLIASNKDRKSLAIETMKTDPGLMPMVMAMYEGDENKVERVVNAVFIDASSEKRR